MAQDDGWRLRAMVIGGVLGALTGVGAAYLMTRRWEEAESPPRLTPGEGMRLGLLVLGMLREVSRLGDDEG